nr:uncharacterized protein LOC115934345 isoform X4 [Gorilla gorilla gorilla]
MSAVFAETPGGQRHACRLHHCITTTQHYRGTCPDNQHVRRLNTTLYGNSQVGVYRCIQQLQRDSDERERAMIMAVVLSKRKWGYVGKRKRDQTVTVST